MDDGDSEQDFKRRGTPKGGKLYKGVVLQHARTISTIPSKSELSGPPPSHTREKASSAPRTRRTTPFPDGGDRMYTPGPGAYTNQTPSLPPPSVSKKGMGNGFASATQRFPTAPPAVYRAPGPGQYYDPQKQSSIHIAPAKPPTQPTEHPPPPKPTPGPGTYDPHDPQYPVVNQRGSSQFLDSSQRTTFIPEQDVHEQRLGPGVYDPKEPEKTSQVISPFVSHTKRELPLGSTITPGPGAYIDEENKEKAPKPPKPRPQGKLASPSPTHKNSSMYKRAAEKKRESLGVPSPGPGEYLLRDKEKKEEAPLRPSPVSPPRFRNASPDHATSSFASRLERTQPLVLPTIDNVGPGAYHTDTQLIKPSFHANRTDSWV